MFGLEKSPREKFNFDLEVDLKENPKKATELLKRCESIINKIKNKLKSGGSKEELNKLGVLLQGYISLVKVLKTSLKT